MVESFARTVLKQGMKGWIVTSERLQARFAQLREDLEDVVVEARYEYEHRAGTSAEPDVNAEPIEAATPKRKTPRKQTGDASKSAAPVDPAVAV